MCLKHKSRDSHYDNHKKVIQVLRMMRNPDLGFQQQQSIEFVKGYGSRIKWSGTKEWIFHGKTFITSFSRNSAFVESVPSPL